MHNLSNAAQMVDSQLRRVDLLAFPPFDCTFGCKKGPAALPKLATCVISTLP